MMAAGIVGAGAQTPPVPIGPDQPTTTTTEPANDAGDDPGSTTTSTTTTTQPPVITPRPTPPPDSSPPSSTTTTTTSTPPRTTEDSLPPPPDHAGDGDAPPADAGSFPADLRARMEAVVRTPANSTKHLLAALEPLSEFGLDGTERAVVGFGRFPVAGEANYSHDWWFPRFGPGWRLHEGTDIFAAHGTPLRAPVDGRVRLRNGGLGGVTVTVFEPDGTYWYLAHLSGIATGLVDGAAVRTGDVVGFVGTSGNAAGTPPHVHLQIHPGGGGPIDPKPVLDRFMTDALALAPQVIDAYRRAAVPPPPVATALPVAEPAFDHRSVALWTASVSPASGVLHIAMHEAQRVAATLDWGERAKSTRPVARRFRSRPWSARWFSAPAPRSSRGPDLERRRGPAR